jgi:hypothetical protein
MSNIKKFMYCTQQHPQFFVAVITCNTTPPGTIPFASHPRCSNSPTASSDATHPRANSLYAAASFLAYLGANTASEAATHAEKDFGISRSYLPTALKYAALQATLLRLYVKHEGWPARRAPGSMCRFERKKAALAAYRGDDKS